MWGWFDEEEVALRTVFEVQGVVDVLISVRERVVVVPLVPDL